MLLPQERQEIEKALNILWEMHDDAEKEGNSALANEVADKAFQLLARLPENTVTLSTKQ